MKIVEKYGNKVSLNRNLNKYFEEKKYLKMISVHSVILIDHFFEERNWVTNEQVCNMQRQLLIDT